MADQTVIRAVLFDADGVIQTGLSTNPQPLRELLGLSPELFPKFLQELFVAERAALTGNQSLENHLASLLSRWNSRDGVRVGVEDILRALTTIEVDAGVMRIIQSLRAAGLPCCLASNQALGRARYMSETLQYRAAFDREFYSCYMGAAKPDPEFFRIILGEIALPAASVLFLDDHEVNVAAAREVGIHAAPFVCEPGDRRADLMRSILRQYGVPVS